MSRIITVSILVLMTAACQPPLKPASTVPDLSHTHPRCEPSVLKSWIGKDVGLLDPASGENIRILTPGAVVTKDYQKNRLNLYLDQNGRVQRADCG